MKKSLEDLRKEIDAIDHELLQILAKRMGAVKKVGELKKELNLPTASEERRKQVLEFYISQAQKLSLSENFVQKLYELIHDHALEIEKK